MYLSRKGREKLKSDRRYEEVEELPSPEEKRIFEEFVEAKITVALKYFSKEDFSDSVIFLANYETLNECLPVQILLFNIRRPGEVGKTLLVDYRTARKIDAKSPEWKLMNG